jgi:uncharacterized protein (TIGR02145 family)
MKNLINTLFLSVMLFSLAITGCKKDPEPPAVITNAVSDITLTTAKSGGGIINEGGADIINKGICWGTTSNPSISGNYSVDGAGPGEFTSDMADLIEGTVYYVRAYATNSAGTGYGNEETFTTLLSTVASVTTRAATEITYTTAVSGGDVSTDGGAAITAKGICWNTAENPTIDNNHTTYTGSENGFTGSMTGLTQGTVYYIRAYATNNKGTAYGNQVTFTTVANSVAVLTTKAVSAITLTSASSGGDITSDGGSPITEKGICWNTAENPTIANNHISGGTGMVGFVSNLTGLTEGTTYYVRAYATNGKGTAYGNQVSFSTSPASIPVLTTKEISEITFSSAKSGGDITSDGGSAITEKGICWNTTENPTITNNHISGGTGIEGFVSNISGLTEGTTYYVRAYATNSKGTAYGNQQSFRTVPATIAIITTKGISDITLNSAKSGGDITSDGGAAVISKGICWNTSENPTTANNHTSDGTGTSAFVSALSGLRDATRYYVRAYAVNSKGTAYGNQESFTTTAANAVQLITAEVTGLTSVAGISGGYISSDGGTPVTDRGVCWSTSPHPTVLNTKTSDGTGTGTFISNVTGLTNGTVYYLRSYATNSTGVSYGNEFKFITPVTDIEGNVYKTVAIGNQVWMAENLRTTKFRDNTDIPNIVADADWAALDAAKGTGYCWYLNNATYKSTYGAIYSWFTVATDNLCPAGWHVPTYSEHNALELFIGVPADSINAWGWRGVGKGTELKSNTGWDGNNLSGFSALPSGYRAWLNGEFRGAGQLTYFWTSTDDSMNHKPEIAWYRRLDGGDTRIYNASTNKGGGKYARCIKNP